MSLQSEKRREEQLMKSETLNDKLNRILELLEQIAGNTRQPFNFIDPPPQIWTDGIQYHDTQDNPPPNIVVNLDAKDLPETPFIGEVEA